MPWKRISYAVNEVVSHRPGVVIILFSAAFLLCTSLIGSTLLMWNDELLTYHAAKLPVPELLAFFSHGLDAHTPVTALAVHLSLALFGDNHFAVRFPTILGFWLGCLCLYAFASRRLPASYALAAMILPAATIAVYFATDARAYGLLFGFAGLALVCWQRAAEEGRHWLWLAGFGLSLAACASVHYYAVLLWIPFGLAELVRWRERGKPDFALWLIGLAALFPIIVYLPFIRAARVAYSGTQSTRISSSRLSTTVLIVRNLIPLPLVVTLILCAVLSRWSKPEGAPLAQPRSEKVLVGALALLLVFELPLAFVAGQYGERYVLEALLGITLLLVTLMAWLARGDSRFGTVLAIAFFGFFILKSASTVRAQMAESKGLPFHSAQPFHDKEWVKEIQKSSLPVVLVPATFFMQFRFYAPADLRSRIIFPYNAEEVLRSGHPNTDDREMELWAAAGLAPDVVPYDAFTAANRRFLLCVDHVAFAWQIPKLLRDGATLKLLVDGNPTLYEVSQSSSAIASR